MVNVVCAGCAREAGEAERRSDARRDAGGSRLQEMPASKLFVPFHAASWIVVVVVVD